MLHCFICPSPGLLETLFDLFLGSKVHSRGSVISARVLGALALIDEGETDWKIVAIDVNDDLANDVIDLKRFVTH